MPVHAGVCPPFAETLVIGAVAATELALKQLQEFLFTSLSKQMESYDKLQITATKTLTMQVATAAKAQMNANVAIKEGEMAALAHLESVKQQAEIFRNFSLQTGQGIDPCGQLAAQSAVTVAGGKVRAMAAETLSQVAAAPGRYGSPEAFAQRVFQQRRTMFATDDEVKLGFGLGAGSVVTSNGSNFSLAGADTNAEILFVDSKDPRVAVAKQAYLNHVAGAPDLPISSDMAALPVGKEYLALKSRKDAAMSVALNSLATIANENAPNPEVGKSNMQVLRELVGQYYGNDAKSRWAGWTSQSQRGLMLDQLKIDASMLALEFEQLRQSQRMEALMGTLLALEAQREFKPALNNAARSISATQSQPGVR